MEPEILDIPSPSEVQEKLARNLRERRLLRSLYRLSCRAIEESNEHKRLFGQAGKTLSREAVPC